MLNQYFLEHMHAYTQISSSKYSTVTHPLPVMDDDESEKFLIFSLSSITP